MGYVKAQAWNQETDLYSMRQGTLYDWRRTEPMTPDELIKLIDTYGNASFDCGEWQPVFNPSEPYDALVARQQEARRALIDAIVPAIQEQSE